MLIGLLMILLMYGGPTLVASFLWVASGWHFALSAAPAAYNKALEFNGGVLTSNEIADKVGQKSKEMSARQNELWKIHPRSHMSISGCNCDIAKEWEDSVLNSGKAIELYKKEVSKTPRNAEKEAKKTGKTCLLLGPFAYFKTPEWKNKIEIHWYPAEITANRLVVNTGNTLEKVHELGSSVKSALDLSDNKDLEKSLSIPLDLSKNNPFAKTVRSPSGTYYRLDPKSAEYIGLNWGGWALVDE